MLRWILPVSQLGHDDVKRSGGLASYAEDAYGKDGYFQAFFLYFLSLAIGNVAIGISAVGYLATFARPEQ